MGSTVGISVLFTDLVGPTSLASDLGPVEAEPLVALAEVRGSSGAPGAGESVARAAELVERYGIECLREQVRAHGG